MACQEVLFSEWGPRFSLFIIIFSQVHNHSPLRRRLPLPSTGGSCRLLGWVLQLSAEPSHLCLLQQRLQGSLQENLRFLLQVCLSVGNPPSISAQPVAKHYKISRFHLCGLGRGVSQIAPVLFKSYWIDCILNAIPITRYMIPEHRTRDPLLKGIRWSIKLSRREDKKMLRNKKYIHRTWGSSTSFYTKLNTCCILLAIKFYMGKRVLRLVSRGAYPNFHKQFDSK